MNKQSKIAKTTARLATLDELIQSVLPLFVAPIPPKSTLREWFENLPQFKQNPAAKRGGGPVYYSVSAVEKFFQSRTIGGLR